MKTFVLFLGLAAAAGSMHAGPISYTFNFTGGSPNPFGSFSYDSSTNTFSNVVLSWDGVPQPSSWTNAFNQASPPNLCGSLDGPAAVFQILTQGTCGGAQWGASNSPFSLGIEDYNLTLTFNGNSGWNNDNVVVSSAPLISTSGTVTASATTPEPSSVALCFAGAALLVWKRKRSVRASGLETGTVGCP